MILVCHCRKYHWYTFNRSRLARCSIINLCFAFIYLAPSILLNIKTYFEAIKHMNPMDQFLVKENWKCSSKSLFFCTCRTAHLLMQHWLHLRQQLIHSGRRETINQFLSFLFYFRFFVIGFWWGQVEGAPFGPSFPPCYPSSTPPWMESVASVKSG